MQAQRWDEAYAGAQTLTEDDCEDAPAARQAVAMALITHNVPADLRGVVASGTPLDAASFPLFDTVEAVRDRRAAAALLDSATETADRFKRSEEHTSELQSLMRISYAVFCLKKKKKTLR